MSIPKKLAKVIQKLYRQLLKLSRTLTKGVMTWLLRRLMVLRRRSGFAGAGFILPTVTMVILVVILLTTAMVFRSFDRAKNARNYRVNEEVMASAAPAIERAKAKLDALFDDPRLPRATPSDDALYGLLRTDNQKFTFPDEQRLKLAYNIDGGNITPEEDANILEEGETISTAWRFPVDTDGDGSFDSFTLYNIVFRSPARDPNNGAFAAARSPLDATAPPMDDGFASPTCAAALSTSAKLVTQAGWYRSGSKLAKSFFVYTATVPIADLDELNATIPSGERGKYETYTGSPGFSALEYQQDRARIPLSNNAVVFEDDLAVVAGDTLRLNGSMITNSNLFTTTTEGGQIELYQVSADESCFYQPENSKISVGGHIINSAPLASQPNGKDVRVDLFVRGAEPNEKKLKQNEQSAAGESPQKVLYNSQAYTRRLNHLTTTWINGNDPGSEGFHQDDPSDVQTRVKEAEESEQERVRSEALFAYFQERTRRVPFDEVAVGVEESFGSADNPLGGGEALRPPDKWSLPYAPDGKSAANQYANITLNLNGTDKVYPEATEPATLEDDEKENFVGDRILVGNNLPAVYYDSQNIPRTEQAIDGTVWDRDKTEPEDSTRVRSSQIKSLADVGDKGRNGFWEKAAARQPKNNLDPVGGLRIVTGAGVYERRNSFLPPPTYDDPTTAQIEQSRTFDDPATPGTEAYPIVWPDTMPMSPAVGLQVYNNLSVNGTVGWNPISLPADPDDPTQTQLDLEDATFSYNPPPGPPAQTIDPRTPQYAKGDLRMRATAVYHYVTDRYQDPTEGNDQQQTAIACVSSYYDPTNATTARNPQGLPDVSGQLDLPSSPQPDNGGSNNGVSYPKPSRTGLGPPQMNPDPTSGLLDNQGDETYGSNFNRRLAYQANLVFPNGRFVNQPLREALKKSRNNRTLADQSAIESTICALDILDGAQPTDADIPHGAISEVAFLDSRQIQGIDEDDLETTKVESVADLTGEYDLSIEERQPLEIRATKIDLDLLRKTTISGSVNGPTPEYLLPNSGIIYASRDDAQPDLSSLDHDQLLGEKLTPTEKAEKLRESAVDYKLDPTRRPNGILLFNGKKLARADSELFREAEKGLTLVTNLPAYVWAWSDSNGDGIVDDTDEPVFNPHSKEEFDRTLNPNWNNFYNRGEPDENFACRPNDPRLPKCTTGDTWRPATVIADSMTLLSRDFRFGFRNEGDYDLRNNNPGNQATINNRRRNGFFANTYATNGLSSQNPAAFETRNFTDATYSNRTNLPDNSSSSYFNNFVTPVQRRRNNFPEYVMEICRKFPVSECQPQDWVIGYDSDGDGILAPGEANVRIDQLQPQITNSGGPNIATLINWTTPYGGGGSPLDRLGAGTTAQPALNPADQRYARRVAFARTSNQMLVLDGTGAAQPIGVGCPLTGCVYPTVPRTVANALWFRTTTNTAGNPGLATDISYRDNQPLYYETDAFKYGPAVQYAGTETVKYVEDSTGVSSAAGVNPVRLFIPKTPEDSAYEIPQLSQLNSGTDPVSGYFMCLGSGTVKAEPGNTQLSSVSIAGSCPGNINPLRNALLQLNPATPNDAIVQPAGALPNLIAESTSDAAPNPNSFKSVNVYDLGTSLGGNITLEGTPDSIFVLRIPANSSLTFAADTQITLDGVNPNNIFWVFGNNSDVIFEAGAQIAGNFIGHGGGNIQFPASNNVQVLGGRFLGFGDVLNNAGTSITGAPIDFANPVNPITSQDQPLLVPVLQLHSPNVDNQGWTGIDVQGRVLGSRWLPPATETETTFNLITAVGNTPPRPGEPDGGAATFVRLVEDWFGTDLSISGSLMEFNRSSIATGPFQPFVQTGTFFDNQGGIFNYPQKYATDNSDGKLPSYQRANRGFGYDVGLLSQLPDLFSGRFTTPPAGAPNEFFQEVNRDEDQIKTLLCAGVINNADDQNATAYQTSNRAVNTTYVPDGCPNLSDY